MLMASGGERGIRTPGALSGTDAFEASGFNHSPISPRDLSVVFFNFNNRRLDFPGRVFPPWLHKKSPFPGSLDPAQPQTATALENKAAACADQCWKERLPCLDDCDT